MKNQHLTYKSICVLSTLSLMSMPAFCEPTAKKLQTAPGQAKSEQKKQTPEGKEIEKKIEERDFPEALNLLNKYLQKHPTKAAAYLKRGQVCQTMGRHSEALIDFSTTIKLDPTCVPAYVHRSYQYKRLNQIEKAKQDLLKLHEIDPVHFKKVDAIKLDNAFKKMDSNAAKRDSEYPFLRTFSEARAAGFAGEYEKAHTLFDQLIKDMPAIKSKFENKDGANRFAALSYYNHSYWFLIHQRYDLALKDLNMALENYPDYHDALMNRAKLYELIKNPDLAKKDKARAAEIEKKQKINPNFGL